MHSAEKSNICSLFCMSPGGSSTVFYSYIWFAKFPKEECKDVDSTTSPFIFQQETYSRHN